MAQSNQDRGDDDAAPTPMPSAVQKVLQKEINKAQEAIRTRAPMSVPQRSILHTLARMTQVIAEVCADRQLPYHKVVNSILLSLLDHFVVAQQAHILYDLAELCIMHVWARLMDDGLQDNCKNFDAAFSKDSRPLGAERDDQKSTHMFIYQGLLSNAKSLQQTLADLYKGSTLRGLERWHGYEEGWDPRTARPKICGNMFTNARTDFSCVQLQLLPTCRCSTPCH
jgi:hypothetical protein